MNSLTFLIERGSSLNNILCCYVSFTFPFMAFFADGDSAIPPWINSLDYFVFEELFNSVGLGGYEIKGINILMSELSFAGAAWIPLVDVCYI